MNTSTKGQLRFTEGNLRFTEGSLRFTKGNLRFTEKKLNFFTDKPSYILYLDYTVESLLLDLVSNIKKYSKKNTEPIYHKIDFNFNSNLKCNICNKHASYKNLMNDTYVCWDHAF